MTAGHGSSDERRPPDEPERAELAEPTPDEPTPDEQATPASAESRWLTAAAAPARSAETADTAEAAEPEQPVGDDATVPWHRLSPYTVVVTLVVVGGIALGTAAILVFAGVSSVWVLALALAAVVVIVGPEFLRWQRTSYRLTAERLEVRSGVLVRASTSVPRDRIRSVDVTADPVSRIFGIAVVKIGTGQHVRGGASEAKLDSLPVADAERLRSELLRRDRMASAVDASEVTDDALDTRSAAGAATTTSGQRPGLGSGREPSELARFFLGWIRYAPVGLLTPILGAAAIGGLFQVAGWFERLPWQLGIVRPVVEAFTGSLLVLGLVLLVVGFLLVGAIGATAIWIETWWNYRLEYGDGVFRVRRGLLTTRSISFEEARLRGVELVESVTLRRFGVGQPNVVATGMETRADQEKGAGRKALMPPVPLTELHPVVAELLDESSSPLSDVRFTTHPKAARRRRLVWSLSGVTATAAVLVLLGLWLTTWLVWTGLVVALLGYAIVPLFAVDAYRNLGHALNGRFLVTRHGTLLRRTVALQRSGVIGWKVRQSFFQRRAGIATVTATTAAGGGKYAVYDAELGEGLDFADAAVPDLLAPFLDRPSPK